MHLASHTCTQLVRPWSIPRNPNALASHDRYNQPTTASIAEVLASYSASFSSDRQGMPGPKPLYQESNKVHPPASCNLPNATDFQLFRLAAGDLPGTDPAQGIADLLRPVGMLSAHLVAISGCAISSQRQGLIACALAECSPTWQLCVWRHPCSCCVAT